MKIKDSNKIGLCLLFAALGILLAIIVNLFFGIVKVEGISMEPNFHEGELLLITKKNQNYNINDIIVANIVTINNGKKTRIMKRIVAVAGDTIEIKKGILYRNEQKINEPYLKNAMNKKENFDKLKVPQGEVFVLGDNRNYSYDSRDQGTIKVSDIFGKVKALH